MKNRVVRICDIATLFVCASLLSPLAAAVERGFYVGGYYGQASSSYDKAIFDTVAANIYLSGNFTTTDSVSTLESEAGSYGFFGGYRLYRHLAIEGGYVDLGKLAYRETSHGTYPPDPNTNPPTPERFTSYSQSFDLQTRGLAVSALGIWPLSYRLEVFARGGFIYANNKIEGSIRDEFGASFSLGEDTESGIHWLAGAGAGMTFAEVYTLRLEYQRILDVGDESMDTSDIDLIALGVTVAF